MSIYQNERRVRVFLNMILTPKKQDIFEVTLPLFTLSGTGVPISISEPSALLFTTLSSILPPLSAAASLYNLRQLVK